LISKFFDIRKYIIPASAVKSGTMVLQLKRISSSWKEAVIVSIRTVALIVPCGILILSKNENIIPPTSFFVMF
jgi:hypothetical protein